MFDVHSHKIENQDGGFILSIDGEPSVPGGETYLELKKLKYPKNFIIVPYLKDLNDFFDERIIYIHPRRNRFSKIHIDDYLTNSSAKLVIIDTFSSFFWTSRDYYDLVKKFSNKIFLLAHGGGYRIREFVELCRYSANCFIDFSATQEIFGCVNGDLDLDCGILSLIKHSLKEPRIKQKVLFGSDNPEFNQMQAYEFYLGIHRDIPKKLDENFLMLIESVS